MKSTLFATLALLIPLSFTAEPAHAVRGRTHCCKHQRQRNRNRAPFARMILKGYMPMRDAGSGKVVFVRYPRGFIAKQKASNYGQVTFRQMVKRGWIPVPLADGQVRMSSTLEPLYHALTQTKPGRPSQGDQAYPTRPDNIDGPWTPRPGNGKGGGSKQRPGTAYPTRPDNIDGPWQPRPTKGNGGIIEWPGL